MLDLGIIKGMVRDTSQMKHENKKIEIGNNMLHEHRLGSSTFCLGLKDSFKEDLH